MEVKACLFDLKQLLKAEIKYMETLDKNSDAGKLY